MHLGSKKETIGHEPPSSPTGTSEYWALLVKDGEYLGEFPSWSDVENKPFSTLNSDNFEVDEDGELSVKTADTDWDGVENKPFSTLSDTFSTTSDELDVKIDGTTIYKDADGTLKANPSSAGFDIHSLQAETTLSNTDEFPFYDVSANGTRKTLWSNIVAKLTALFSKIYDSNTEIVLTTSIKDTIAEVNANSSANQLAGALAVKSVYQGVAPIPTSAPQYSTTSKYAKGDTCSYSGAIYYCIADITTGEQFNPSKWVLWDSNQQIRFGVDSDGNYGYYKVGADSVTPFKTGGTGFSTLVRETLGTVSNSSTTYDIATLFPNLDLTNVTQANFAVVPKVGINNSTWAYNDAVFDHSIRPQAKLTVGIPSITYNTSSHKVTVSPAVAKAEGRGYNSGAGASAVATQSGYITYTVYFYHT